MGTIKSSKIVNHNESQATMIDADQTAVQESKARVITTTHAKDSSSSTRELSAIEQAFKTCKIEVTQTAEDTITVSAQKPAAKSYFMRVIELFAGHYTIMGVDTKTSHMIVKLDNISEIENHAKNHQRVARVASGEKRFNVETTYTYCENMVNRDSKNIPVKTRLDDDGIGGMYLESGVVLNVESADQSKFGKGSKNGKPRRMFYVEITYEDQTKETLSSYWIQGLMDQVNAKKRALIVG